MRRLAKNTRNDKYVSNRDYQSLTYANAFVITLNSNNNKIVLSNRSEKGINGFGGYIFPNKDTKLKVSIMQNGNLITSKKYNLVNEWNRIGLTWNSTSRSVQIILEFDGVKAVKLWGINSSLIDFDNLTSERVNLEEALSRITQSHLIPESFYLEHSLPLHLPIEDTENLIIKESINAIQLKKCSYCQRKLPVNKNIPFSSFHNHKSKKSGFQNECRSCKKWRINDSFNPNRTKDQLHESSVITRERKLLLREPEILQAIKDRHSGEGLKSLVWKKFKKRCFNCNTKLLLSEVRLDHTRPLAYLYPLDEYATCLCETCNNTKHDSFPVDFYKSEEKLKQLAAITGLPYSSLIKKDINETELTRILDNIEEFAIKLDPRTFRSIANKVIEMRPAIDLFKILKVRNKKLYRSLIKNLAERPD